ncbi:hypothetical protein CGMCC3_g6568 [Colletotrichum fructicola]|nr:uncharacterized protein CGMCC3_g6568 [Colletotrichum fructicola]KAE9577443.1 hypothetical protein CGMCC3_g6568 [Colletotrichum fructicola]
MTVSLRFFLLFLGIIQPTARHATMLNKLQLHFLVGRNFGARA